jgi:hypothetical protein
MHTDSLKERVSPYDILLARIDDVIAEWRTLVQREPWARIPPMRLVDSFPEILPKLFRDARDGAQHVSKELSELIAEAHGSFRRQDAIPLGAVAEEWIQVKHACRNVLERHGVSETDSRLHVQRMTRSLMMQSDIPCAATMPPSSIRCAGVGSSVVTT